MTFQQRVVAPLRRTAGRIGRRTRLTSRRDARRAEREHLGTELNRLRIENERLKTRLENVVRPARNPWVQFHAQWENLSAPVAYNRARLATGDDDRKLVVRIIEAYCRTIDENFYGDDSMWRLFRQHQGTVHTALVEHNVADVTRILRDADQSDLLFGYEMYQFAEREREERGPLSLLVHDTTAQEAANMTMDFLARLAEALDVVPLEYPEGEYGVAWGVNLLRDPDDVARRIEEHVGFALPILPVQSGLAGLAIRDGMVNGKTMPAAYIVHRMGQLLGDGTRRVLEIGAGLGYTVVYAHRLGITDYTVVDLPMTNVAQAYFIGRTVGEEQIVLEGEPGQDRADAIKIRTPIFVRESARPFDLITNVDSLTEVGRERAAEYARWIFRSAPVFLSVNHEANGFAVGDLFKGLGAVVDRFPFWMRNGYTEEIIRVPSAQG